MADVHIEIGQQYLTFDFDLTVPDLILAGDIGRLVDYDGYLSFLQRQIARYKHVFLVLGNHEFHGLSFRDDLARARALEKEPILERRLTLLQRDTFSFEDEQALVVGCALWSVIHAREISARGQGCCVTQGQILGHKSSTGFLRIRTGRRISK